MSYDCILTILITYCLLYQTAQTLMRRRKKAASHLFICLSGSTMFVNVSFSDHLHKYIPAACYAPAVGTVKRVIDLISTKLLRIDICQTGQNYSFLTLNQYKHRIFFVGSCPDQTPPRTQYSESFALLVLSTFQ